MNIKALIATLIIGSSTAAMAQPMRFSASASASAHVQFKPVVRDHRISATDYNDNYQVSRTVQPSCEIESVSGLYSSNFGRVMLTQRGNRVTGYYPSQNGTIDGVIEGNELHYHWQQSSGEGYGVWFLDGRGLSGTYGNGRSTTNGGPWNLLPIT